MLKNLTDEELVRLAQDNDADACGELIDRFKPFIKTKTRPYFLIGGEAQDLMQEGMVGLLRAIATFDGQRNFKVYASKCIKNALISAIKRNNTLKNSALNTSVSIFGVDGDIDNMLNFSVREPNPEDIYIDKEEAQSLLEGIKNSLSKFEYEMLLLYLQEYTYLEIANRLNKDVKSIDNALQRIRKKLSLNKKQEDK